MSNSTKAKRNNKARIIMFPSTFGSAEFSGYIEIPEGVPAGTKLNFELYKDVTSTGKAVHKGPGFTLEPVMEV